MLYFVLSKGDKDSKVSSIRSESTFSKYEFNFQIVGSFIFRFDEFQVYAVRGMDE